MNGTVAPSLSHFTTFKSSLVVLIPLLFCAALAYEWVQNLEQDITATPWYSL